MSTQKVILVLTAGWVIICNRSLSDQTKVTNARVLQRWGTTEGLAEVALRGPTPSTTMSAPFDGEVPLAGVIFTLYVADSVSWN